MLHVIFYCLSLTLYNIVAGEGSSYCKKFTNDCHAMEHQTESGTALAVVPYTEDSLLPHHRPTRDFHLGGHDIHIQQDWGSLGVAAVVWDAAIVLCEYLELHPEVVGQKQVVELGAGTGLVGIVASYLGGHVTVTERREAMPNLRKTVNSNTVDSCPGSITAKELDWTTDLSPHPQYDVILGADIVYIEDTFQALLRTLVHTAREDTVVLLSCRIRYDRDLHFLTLLESHFVVEQIHYDKSRDIKIFSAKKIKTKT
ncbi:protein N-lysine methyltransferase METTL21A-like isoform X2 [Haliotis rufescens]|uniref:protein N-lysine methyltransferase METTL21A-like isoform X2 n=1 Tax=Haliotis rufescens TaxID=6454 RepID=UPI00201EB1DA|nr:protein N-lysine methyltransferase METTL21A-like isoform X2 [Haliotis rufescens]